MRRRGADRRTAVGRRRVIGYGERGFGFDLDPITRLVETLAAVPAVARAAGSGCRSELPGADVRLGDDLRLRRRRKLDAAPHQTRQGLGRAREDRSRVRAVLDRAACRGRQARLRARAEIELYTAAQSTAQIASGGPIEFVCDLLSGPATADVCCPVSRRRDPPARDRRSGCRRHRRPNRRLLGRQRRNVYRRGAIPMPKRHGTCSSTCWRRRGSRSCRAQRAPHLRPDAGTESRRPCRRASFRITAVTRSA